MEKARGLNDVKGGAVCGERCFYIKLGSRMERFMDMNVVQRIKSDT